MKIRANNSNLVCKTDYDAIISNIEAKYFITSDYNKFMGEIFDAKIKEKELVDKSDISRFKDSSDLDTTLATKAELKLEHDKITKL